MSQTTSSFVPCGGNPFLVSLLLFSYCGIKGGSFHYCLMSIAYLHLFASSLSLSCLNSQFNWPHILIQIEKNGP